MTNNQIEERYLDQRPRSAALFERAINNFPNGVTHDSRKRTPFPIYLTHGLGPHMWDVDGNKYIEYFGGHGALILGQSHPAVVKAVQDQMERATHLSASTEVEIEWADWIKKLIPCAEKVRFTSSGTEAVMMALRMARSFTGKSKIIKFQDHFHGWSDYAMAGASAGVDGIPDETRSTMIVLPPGDISLINRTLDDNDDIAAIIVESTGAHMGASPIHPNFLHELRSITKKRDVVFIMDEVVTGFRISPGGTQGAWDVTPDLCSLAKIVGGGLPGGAVAGKADIVNAIERGNVYHPGTFNANPLSASAGSAALELVATTPVNARADAAAERLKNGLNDVFARLEIPGHAFGTASIVHLRIGIHAQIDQYGIITGETTGVKIDAEADRLLGLAMNNEGIETHNRFDLSMTHTDRDVDRTITAFEHSLGAIRDLSLI